MKYKLFLLACLAVLCAGCQFTETMVLQQDGSGTMKVEVNLNEMMAFSQMSGGDTALVKLDTLIKMKDFLREKKDSIATLPEKDREKLEKMENFNFHINMDSEAGIMVYDISTKFRSVSEANDILNGVEQAGNLLPTSAATPGQDQEEEDTPELIGVEYSYKNNTFRRNGYIIDKTLHQQQVDSLKKTEAFFGSSNYTLDYTFPKKIKKAILNGEPLTTEGKSIVIKRPFIQYFKNPDILDLEVELEK